MSTKADLANIPEELIGEAPKNGESKKEPAVNQLFRMVMKHEASDLHLKVGQPPMMRIRGDIRRLELRPLTQEDMERLLLPNLSPKHRRILEEEGGVDYSYVIGQDECRFRVSLFKQRSRLSLVARRVNNNIPNFATLGLPPSIEKLCNYPEGLVILAGVTGSGKSTTIASMLDYINEREPLHILTVEDPIEFVFTDKKAYINQREIGLDSRDWHKALKDAVRQDPDIILVGELRDVETFEAAVHAAETGHLVFGTIHASSAGTTINRILDLFPPEKHGAIRAALANNLKAVVAQKLVKGLKKGRVPTNEIMIVNPTIRELIAKGEDRKIPDAIRIGYLEGMVDFNENLRQLVDRGDIDKATALEISPNPDQLKMALKGIKVAAPGILQMIGMVTDWMAARCRQAVLPLPALSVWLAGDECLWAADSSFPRGPGFYYHPLKLLLVLATFCCWVSLCGWVDRDARKLGIDAWIPNALVLSAGLGGLVIFWLAPAFLLGFPLLLGIIGGTAFCYVHFRNQRVEPPEQVMTERHLLAFLKRYLRFALPSEDADKKRLPVRFIGRTNDSDHADDDRIKKMQESKGYQGALEMVYRAVEQRATDIHLEPAKSEMAVRLRIDGLMTTAAPFSRAMGDAVVNIFKILCNMDITEKRKPQDGGFSAQIKDHIVDFRVATAGSVIGEKMVMRILDKSQQIINLTRLGMRDKMREQIRAIIGQPHGMVLVCGPTGAGKSTTLYACLNEIDRFQQNIITLENPVEFQLENVTQIEVNPKAGKTFASELRSILRQDPDIIMIGEIRDQETAEIACQAAQTGHFVFSTLHANDTVTALGRLIDLGVQPFMIASAVSAVLGQRLVRQLCPTCKVRYKPNPDLLRKANLPAEKIKYFYRPPDEGEKVDQEGETMACDTCGDTGYYKRTGIFELLVITDKIRDLIRANPNLNAIRQEAIRDGMRYIYEDGLRKVLEGETSIQELLRVSK